MKPILHLLFFIFFFVELNNEIVAQNTNADTTLKTKLILANDSGFVSLKEGLDFLLANSLIDTTPNANYWYSFKTDTIGKYYRIENSDHYIMCLIDYESKGKYWFDTRIIIEIDAKGELVKSERFLRGIYPCSWDNDYQKGFSKYGNFFGIKMCHTGPSYSDTYLYLFKEVTPQDSINPIHFFHSLPLLFNLFLAPVSEEVFINISTSSMKIKKDKLIVHYIKIRDKSKYDIYIKVRNINKFRIKYFYKNGEWNTKDKNKLKNFKSFP